MSDENWLPIAGWEGLYEVSDLGNIRRVGSDSTRIPSPNHSGYMGVVISHGPRRARITNHRAVLETFVGPPPEGMQGCHNNGIKTDNRLSNLRWDTPAANASDRVAHGAQYRPSSKATCDAGHAMDEANTSIRHRNGYEMRVCRACARERDRRYRARRFGAVAALALVPLALAAPAFATKGHGHTPIVVCHNVTHNPHVIVVDDDSTKLHAHLAHRTQPQLMDLVEGIDGTADQIRAACVPNPLTTPSPTTTGSTPSATTTATSSPSPSTTSSTPSTTGSTTTTPPSATSTTAPPSSEPTTPHGPPSAISPTPSASDAAPTRHGTTSPRPSAPSSTDAPPELAFTGADSGLLGLGVAGLGVGVALTGTSRRMQGGRH